MEHGDKIIKMTLYFWTDKIDGEPAKVAWDYGTVNAKANKSRDISPNKSGVQFTSLDDLPDAIRKCATLHGIKLLKGKHDAITVKKSSMICASKNSESKGPGSN